MVAGAPGAVPARRARLCARNAHTSPSLPFPRTPRAHYHAVFRLVVLLRAARFFDVFALLEGELRARTASGAARLLAERQATEALRAQVDALTECWETEARARGVVEAASRELQEEVELLRTTLEIAAEERAAMEEGASGGGGGGGGRAHSPAKRNANAYTAKRAEREAVGAGAVSTELALRLGEGTVATRILQEAGGVGGVS